MNLIYRQFLVLMTMTGIAAIPAVADAAPARYSIAEIKGLPGDDVSMAAKGLNNRGQVVGFSQSETAVHAFLWEDDTTMDLLPGVGAFNTAWAINDRGMIAISSDQLGLFVWKDGARLFRLRPLGTNTIPTRMNERGDVIGYTVISIGQGTCTRPVIWQRGIPRRLLALSGCDTFGFPQDINDRGQVVGYWVDEVRTHSFMWQNGRAHEIKGLELPIQINDCGWMVGAEHEGSANGNVLWRNGRIKRFEAWGFNPVDLNNAGDLVGVGPIGAAVFTHGTRLDLNQLIDRRDPDIAGVHLSLAWEINDRGQILATSQGEAGTVFLADSKEARPAPKARPRLQGR